MKLEPADWQTLLPVFRETFKIWSPGLSRRDYLEYQMKQAIHPWARRNLRHLTLNKAERPVSSLKFSTIDLQTRGRRFKIGGIGAVYTQLECRNKGCASELVERVIDLAKQESYDGLILFSDIDCQFYSRFGFEEIGSADLLIHIPFLKGKTEFPENIACGEGGSITIEVDGNSFETRQERFRKEHLDYAVRHYGQWLRRQPYGIVRDQNYFSYKLMRETFLHDHSKLAWPALNITTVKRNGMPCGYAITESAGGVLRVLEIAAPADCREILWTSFLVRALSEKLQRIRAWEGLAADFSPSFNLKQLITKIGLKHLFPDGYKGQLNYYERSWGKGMLLPFDDKLNDLHMTAPCPLVELDHL